MLLSQLEESYQLLHASFEEEFQSNFKFKLIEQSPSVYQGRVLISAPVNK